jgi:hypothetical protein
MGEHDHDQCAHILQKRDKNDSHSHLEQNNLVKYHITYLKDRQMKDVVNTPKKK